MSTTNDDAMGLYNPEVATFDQLSHLIEVSYTEENTDGSVLAASLLQLPDVFTMGTASAIMSSVSFTVTANGRAEADNQYGSVTEIMSDQFKRLSNKDKEEQKLPAIDTTVLEQILEFAQDDPEAARIMYQATAELRAEEQRPMALVESVRMLLSELQRDSQDVTVEQLMLLENHGTAAVAAVAFPNAEQLLRDLVVEDEPTPAEARRLDRLQRAERAKVEGNAARRISEANDLDIMILLDEDPEAIASVALNTKDVESTKMVDILEHAADYQLFYWLFGMEVQQPKGNQIEQLMQRFTTDRIEQLAATCQSMLETYNAHANPVQVPWIVDIIQHVYVPRLSLDAASAALVWHRLYDFCGDDTALWLAVLLADTTDTPTRLQDIV